MKSIKPLREKKNTAILLIHCPDRQGILATVTEFLNKNNGNIIYLDQYVDRAEEIFYMRVEWELNGFAIPSGKISEYFFTLIADKLKMKIHGDQEKDKAVVEVKEWFLKNNLYLTPELRKLFQKLPTKRAVLISFSTMPAKPFEKPRTKRGSISAPCANSARNSEMALRSEARCSAQSRSSLWRASS